MHRLLRRDEWVIVEKQPLLDGRICCVRAQNPAQS